MKPLTLVVAMAAFLLFVASAVGSPKFFTIPTNLDNNPTKRVEYTKKDYSKADHIVITHRTLIYTLGKNPDKGKPNTRLGCAALGALYRAYSLSEARFKRDGIRALSLVWYTQAEDEDIPGMASLVTFLFYTFDDDMVRIVLLPVDDDMDPVFPALVVEGDANDGVAKGCRNLLNS